MHFMNLCVLWIRNDFPSIFLHEIKCSNKPAFGKLNRNLILDLTNQFQLSHLSRDCFALPNRLHFNSVYLIRVTFLNGIAVCISMRTIAHPAYCLRFSSSVVLIAEFYGEGAEIQ